MKEIFGMLNDEEAVSNIELIKTTAQALWGNNCVFGELKELESPYPEFEWSLLLYNKIDVGVYYDRSALDLGIKKNGKYELLSKFTDENVFRGMKAMNPENLLHNFQVLDRILKKQMV